VPDHSYLGGGEEKIFLDQGEVIVAWERENNKNEEVIGYQKKDFTIHRGIRASKPRREYRAWGTEGEGGRPYNQILTIPRND